MNTAHWLTALPAALLAVPALGADCRFSAERTANVEAAAAARVIVKAGAGELTITGEQDRTAVSAKGRACASSQALLDQILLSARREGDVVHVATTLPEPTGALLGNAYARLDLTLLAPRAAAIDVEDSSGDLTITNVRAASVDDSSGELLIRGIAENLDVNDSSGAIKIADVGGDVRLEDSSGDIDVAEVRGNVEVTDDGSGGIFVRKVGGRVHILNDGSGGIEISDVQGDVAIDRDGSGGVSVDRIGGSFTVGADGSGRIRHHDVRGVVRIPDQD